MRRFQSWLFSVALALALVCQAQGSQPANTNASPPLAITGTVFDPSGAPAPGVDVLVVPLMLDPNAPIKSDANGKYTVNWPGPQRVGTRARAMVFSLVARDLEHNSAAAHVIEEGTINLDLHLQPGLTISGKIQDINGRAITNAAATLTIFSGSTDTAMITRPSVNPDDEGRIRFSALPQGCRYRIEVRAPSYGDCALDVPVSSTQTNRLDVRPGLVLKLVNLKLAGQVLDAEGDPVAKVLVNIRGQGQPTTNTQSDATGHFAFDVCDGPVTITAARPMSVTMTGDGLLKGMIVPSAFGRAQAASGGDTNVVIRLDGIPAAISGRRKITGTVFDPSGAPAPGVVVMGLLENGDIEDSISDTNGRFTISWQPRQRLEPRPPRQSMPQVLPPASALPPSPAPPPAPQFLQPALPTPGRAMRTPSPPPPPPQSVQPTAPEMPQPNEGFLLLARDLKNNFAALQMVDEKTANPDLRLQPGLTFRVVVQDEKEQPVPTATETLFLWQGKSSYNMIQFSAKADEQGVIEIKGMPQEQHYSAWINATGYRQANVQAQTGETRTNHFDFPTVLLRAADRKIAGQLLSAEGRPVAKARVDMEGDDQPNSHTTTDAEGHFAFTGLIAGSVRLSALKMDPGGNFIRGYGHAQAGDTNIVLQLGIHK